MYLYTRAKKLNIDDTVLSNISRLINKEGKYEITQLNTNAAGENIFKYIKAPGILNCDLHTIIKREKKLESYKLNFVSSVYISDKKDDLDAMDIFNKCQDTSQNIAIVIKYCVKDTSLVLDLLKKLCILTNTIAMANVCWVPFDYIENKSDYLNGINDNEEIINFTQRSLYKYIFKHVKKYNYQIYKYWPQCIEKLDNSAKVIKFKQKVSSNNYVFDYID